MLLAVKLVIVDWCVSIRLLFRSVHYKQLHGTAMGSPVSVVVAEIVMQNIEEQALSTYTKTLPLWLRYVDDTFTAVHKDEIDTFHEHLNRQNPHVQFTKEIEENGKIPFLDCLVSRDENKLRTTICRKPTHTDRLLDQSSYNPTSHKATTIQTLTRRAQLVCDSTDSLTDETNYLNNVFSKNNYNADFVRRNTYKPAEHNATNANPTPVTTATLPYYTLKSLIEVAVYKDNRVCRHYLTSRALLRQSRGYYNLTTSVLLTNPLRLYDSY